MHLPIPFFVVDRPMSLKALEYCKIGNLTFKIGLMGHANTSTNFQTKFREFSGKNIVKMCDSGVFTKNGCMPNNYSELFSIYENMGAEFGIIIDSIKNKKKTIESAKLAMEKYREYDYNFNLVGVAQGKTVNEYFTCFEELKKIGYDYIAIGGLLKKQVNSVRYLSVASEQFLKDVVSKIRHKYKNDWLFLLGCFHPKRYPIFKKFSIYGGDYKGWIFNYRTPQEMKNLYNKSLVRIEHNIENTKLTKLLLRREKIQEKIIKRNYEEYSRKELKEMLDKIDLEILGEREKIASSFGENYIAKVQIYKNLLSSNREKLREYRFKQIRSYLDKNIFSIFRNNLIIISCSKEVNNNNFFSSAYELHSGTLLNKVKASMVNNSLSDNFQIILLSDCDGVIGFYDLIESYNPQKNTKECSTINVKMLDNLIDRLKTIHDEVFIYATKDAVLFNKIENENVSCIKKMNDERIIELLNLNDSHNTVN